MSEEEVNIIEKPTSDEIVSLVTKEFGDKVQFTQSTKKNIRAINEGRRLFMHLTDKDLIYDVGKYFHDRLNFEQASCVTGVDWVDHMQVVYHLTNYCTAMCVEITIDVPLDDLHVPTIATIWQGANWHEREIYELFGIVFDGHPKLERLLTPQSYEFFPFRKSYKLRGQE